MHLHTLTAVTAATREGVQIPWSWSYREQQWAKGHGLTICIILLWIWWTKRQKIPILICVAILDSVENGNTRGWSDGSAVKSKGGLPEVGIKRQSSESTLITDSFQQACLLSFLYIYFMCMSVSLYVYAPCAFLMLMYVRKGQETPWIRS